MSPEMKDYRIEVRPLAEGEGGGYLAYIPDLPGCQGDGESHEEAIADLRLAFGAWVATSKELGREIPGPGSQELKPIAALVRFPRTLHAELTAVAKSEGTSFNQLVVTQMSQFLGERKGTRSVPQVLGVNFPGLVSYNLGAQVIEALPKRTGLGYVPKATATFSSDPITYETNLSAVQSAQARAFPTIRPLHSKAVARRRPVSSDG